MAVSAKKTTQAGRRCWQRKTWQGLTGLRGAWVALFLFGAGCAALGQVNVTLAWNPSTSSNVVAYRIYQGTASGNYTKVTAVGNTNRATLTNLTYGTTYYFAAKAVDTTGSESVFSNEVSYMPPIPALRLNLAFNATRQPTLAGTAIPGTQFDVQVSEDLRTWTVVARIAADSSGAFAYVDNSTQGRPRRFYRLQQVASAL